MTHCGELRTFICTCNCVFSTFIAAISFLSECKILHGFFVQLVDYSYALHFSLLGLCGCFGCHPLVVFNHNFKLDNLWLSTINPMLRVHFQYIWLLLLLNLISKYKKAMVFPYFFIQRIQIFSAMLCAFDLRLFNKMIVEKSWNNSFLMLSRFNWQKHCALFNEGELSTCVHIQQHTSRYKLIVHAHICAYCYPNRCEYTLPIFASFAQHLH